jgi:mRNA-degrading endonuclease RelE of RelBE toxin-antitoxin system
MTAPFTTRGPRPAQAGAGVDTVRHWRIIRRVEFIETPTFTRLIGKLMDEDEYAQLQLALVLRPDWGKVIPGGGGLRKLRGAGSGRGKRGGLRVIYYWQTADEQIWLLLAYPKSERDDLSHDEIKQLKRLVEEFKV